MTSNMTKAEKRFSSGGEMMTYLRYLKAIDLSKVAAIAPYGYVVCMSKFLTAVTVRNTGIQEY